MRASQGRESILGSSMDSIACRPGLGYLPFVLEHLVPRVPVLVPGASSEIPAVTTWTPALLLERFGDRKLRVDVGGRIEMWTLGDFITRMEVGELGGAPHPP